MDLSGDARNYLAGANKASGKQPDVSWESVPGIWADLTTAGSWGAHVRKYGDDFGEGIALIYERGVGIVETLRLRSGLGGILGGTEAAAMGFCQ